jgi:hypothetical protein
MTLTYTTEEERKTNIVVSLIPLVERNYEALEEVRSVYERTSRTYHTVRGCEEERLDYLKCCDTKLTVDQWANTQGNKSISVILAVLIPHIFSHPHSSQDLLESMKRFKQ